MWNSTLYWQGGGERAACRHVKGTCSYIFLHHMCLLLGLVIEHLLH